MEFFTVKNKGQASIEFLLIILIILIYLQAYIQPAVSNTGHAIEDTKRVGMLKLATEKLANSVNEIAALSGDSKKTIHLFVPAESGLSCSPDDVMVTGTTTLRSKYDSEDEISEALKNTCSVVQPAGEELQITINCKVEEKILAPNVTCFFPNDSNAIIEETVVIKKIDGDVSVFQKP